jgi:5-formyltetrahydrofolate cyclo-ligase
MSSGESGVRSETRERVWSDLREVARPDSRFGWDFSSFIADYQGSDRGAERLLRRGDESGYDSWFVTPDNNLDPLRERLVERNTSFVMPTYGIRRGFVQLTPGDVPDDQAAFAGTLDGVNRFANRISLERMESELPTLDCMITGASFLTIDGLRMGKGHGYFDLEWAMMREIDVVDEETEVVAAVHDVQVLEDVRGRDVAESHDTIVDVIVTPTDVIEIADPPEKPEGIRWELLDRERIDSMPPLKRLWERAGRPDLYV